jgi:murein L,D-transpeptidase YafK
MVNIVRILTLGCVAVPCFAASRTVKPAQPKADHIVVLKSERKLILMHDGKPLKTYRVSLGGEPVGPKTRRGDHKTPEGTYTIDRRNVHSQYHKALHVSYPAASDVAHAHQLHASPGGDIMIHGLPNGWGWLGGGHLAHDWTDGCIAVTDEEIDEIWKLVPDGTPIEIKP